MLQFSKEEAPLEESRLLQTLPAPTRRAVLRALRERFEAAELDAPQRTAEWMLVEALGCRRLDLLTEPNALVAPAALATLDAWLARRLRREPVQYILGYTDFFGLRIDVTPAVLIPRPETEEVVEAALSLLEGLPAPRVLDVGTGSGCIPLAIKARRPEAEVAACDVSAEALAVAQTNGQRLGLDVEWVEADVLHPAAADRLPDRLDLLIANPPYVPPREAATLEPEVRDWEPSRALFTDADPLQFYRVLSRLGTNLLRPGACLVLETHADYGEAVAALLSEDGYADVELHNDLSGRSRIAVGVCR